MKQITKFKRLLSGVLSAVMTVSAVPIVSAHADESTEPYPYTMFAASSDDGAITVNAGNFCVSGNVATNGTIVSSGNMNVNGTRTERSDESMIFIFDKIENQYFSASNVDEHDEDYTLDEMNININVPTEVKGEATLTGNININTALKALEDVNLYGEVKNTNDSVIFSMYGDIVIDSQNVNLNGLVYAPFGSVEINAQNLNLNNVVIIAESIVLTCPNVNANNSSEIAHFIGTASEDCPIITVDKSNMVYDSAHNAYFTNNNFSQLDGYLGKSDEMVSFAIQISDLVGTTIYNSTINPQLKWSVENIGLMCGVNNIELTALDNKGNTYVHKITLVVDSSKYISNMQVDLNDDDGDGLWNYLETYFGTDPQNIDTDGDGLSDYVEIYTLGYNPLSTDSDDNGISDGDEDKDGDGLSNSYECSVLNTSPIFTDSDHDGLQDDIELGFGTSPLLKDTDNDGITDFDEYYLFHTDPLIENAKDMLYTKTFSIEDFDIPYDKGLYPSITISGDSECIKNFNMSSVESNQVINMSMVGYIGSAYSFETTGEMNNAILTFTYDPDLLFISDFDPNNFQPTIYNFDEATGDLIEVENQVWEGNQVKAELKHFSIYLLLNKKEVELYWDSPWLFPETPVVKKAPQKHIAFLLDRSGSMDGNDPNNIRAKLVQEFSTQLNSNDSIKVYSFDNNVIDYTKYGFIHDEDSIAEAVESFINNGNYGGTYIAAALSTVYNDMVDDKNRFDLIKELSADTDSSLEQYIFLLTDGDSFDNPSTELLNNLSDSGIKVYTVGLGSVNSNYLRAISDVTGGKYYYASTSGDLESIYLKFGEDIESSDENDDGLDDYYEYMMCQGLLKTRTGTTAFEGVDYDVLMSNSDYDDDLVKNSDEIEVIFYDDKPYLSIHSDPTLKNSDRDIYSDFQEYNNCTDPLTQSYVINAGEFREIYNKGDYVYAEQADDYISGSEAGIAFTYFVDVVFCGSEDYFDVIASAVGGEDLLVKQDKKLLADYLSTLLNSSDESNDKIKDEGAIDFAISVAKSGNDYLSSLETLVGEKAYDKALTEELKTAISEMRQEIASLQSKIDIARNNKSISRNDYNAEMEKIASWQSDIDRGRFAQKYKEEFAANKQKFNDRFKDFGYALDFVSYGYGRIQSIQDIVEYSNQLAQFGQFKSLLTELSHSDFDYVAEASSAVLKEIKDSEDGNYTSTALSTYFYDAIGDAVDIGLDKAVEKLGGSAAAVFTISKLVIGTFLGENLSLNRLNLLNADFTTELVIIALDDVEYNCGKTITSKLDIQEYICEGAYKCNNTKNMFIYAISARKFGEDKYLDLSAERSGFIGWLFDYNPLDHSTATRAKAYNNTVSLNEKLTRYSCYVKV